MKPKKLTGKRTVFLVALAATLLGLAVVAAPAEEPARQAPAARPAPDANKSPTHPMRRMEKDLLGIQNNITNARMRLRMGMSGMSSAARPDTADGPSTPAEQCCGSNLDRMGEKLRDLRDVLDELNLYYARKRDSAAIGALSELRGNAGLVAQGVAAFRQARTTNRANQALQGLIRPFNELRASVEALEACCPIPDGATDETPADDGIAPES